MFCQSQIFQKVSFEAKDKNGALRISWSSSLTWDLLNTDSGFYNFFWKFIWCLWLLFTEGCCHFNGGKEKYGTWWVIQVNRARPFSVPPHKTLTLK